MNDLSIKFLKKKMNY